MIRTRFAPSPTGYVHIGSIYSVLFNYAFARRFGGKFIIRIEDTDRTRFVDDAEAALFSSLDWFGLTEDESVRKGGPFAPYRQSERLKSYQHAAMQLVSKGHAYYCFCTKERLDEVRLAQQKENKPTMYDKFCRKLTDEEVSNRLEQHESFVIRLKVPENETIRCHDEIRGDILFESHLVDDQVLMKADGYPTYHLAAMVDDHAMEITDVVRGEEWLPSFPKHVLLYQFFTWPMPKFYHTATLRNPDKSKLSKRQNHTNVTWYQENGFLPEAILNYVALLGWGHPENKELFPLEDFISHFDLKDISPVGPVFDLTKLTWMNGLYIRTMSIQSLAKLLITRYPEYEPIGIKTFHQIVSLAQSRIETLNAFPLLVNHFLKFPEPILTPGEKESAVLLAQSLQMLEQWDEDHIFLLMKEVLIAKKIRMPVLYKVLTGAERGLPLPETVVLLGKEETLRRLTSTV